MSFIYISEEISSVHPYKLGTVVALEISEKHHEGNMTKKKFSILLGLLFVVSSVFTAAAATQNQKVL